MLRPQQLAPFFADLRSSGFSVGPVEHQRVIDLLLQLQINGSMPETSDRLCNMLGSILCCSAEQQAQFRQRFVAYFGTWTRQKHVRLPHGLEAGPGADEGKDRNQPTAVDEVDTEATLAAVQRQMLWRFGCIVVAMLVTVLLLPHLLVQSGLLEVPAARRPVVVVGASPSERMKQLSEDGQATIPQKVENSTPMQVFFQSQSRWLSGIVGKTFEAPRAAWSTITEVVDLWVVFLLIPVFAFVGMWIVAPARSSSAYMHRREVRSRPELVQLLVSTVQVNPFNSPDLQRLAQILRRPRMVPSRDLDVETSLSQTIVNGGLFTPVSARRPVAPEHLVLIDRRSGADHVFRYAELLVSALRESQVYVDVYWFNGDIRRLFRAPDTPALSLEEVAGRCPEHRLILIASGERLFDVSTGLVQSWATVLRQFTHRVMLTPVARELWGYRERALDEELEIPILPLLPNSMPRMVELLTAEEPLRMQPPTPLATASSEALARLADLLEDRPLRWIESGVPDAEEVAALDQALRTALNPVVYNWLSACAVYPELTWNLTVHLGSILSTSGNKTKLSAETIVDLARLPWFRLGRMPEWLRRTLAEAMTVELYTTTRRLLHALLLTVLHGASRNERLHAEIERQSPGRSGEIDRAQQAMRDSLLIDFLMRPRRDRSLFLLPQAIARLFRRGGAAGTLLRDLFSREHAAEAAYSAQLLGSAVDEARIARLDVLPPDDGPDDPGRDFRRVSVLRDESGTEVSFMEDTILFLPIGDNPAHLLDRATYELHQRRLSTSRRLAILNAVVATLVVGTFFNLGEYTGNLGLAVVAAFAWIGTPFLVLHLLLPKPIEKAFPLFPIFFPYDASRTFEATAFTRTNQTPVRPINEQVVESTPLSHNSQAFRKLAERLASLGFSEEEIADRLQDRGLDHADALMLAKKVNGG